jgi:Tfp pilus assembly protein PilF
MNRVADELAKRTDVYWHKGDYESMEFLLKMVVELDPSDTDSWSTLGWLQWAGLNNEARAEKTLRAGLAANPRSERMYEELGNYLYRRKRYGEAAAALAKATSLPGADALTFNSYAHALESMGRYPQAASVWVRMKTRFPGNVHSNVNLDRMKRKGEIQEAQR